MPGWPRLHQHQVPSVPLASALPAHREAWAEHSSEAGLTAYLRRHRRLHHPNRHRRPFRRGCPGRRRIRQMRRPSDWRRSRRPLRPCRREGERERVAAWDRHRRPRSAAGTRGWCWPSPRRWRDRRGRPRRGRPQHRPGLRLQRRFANRPCRSRRAGSDRPVGRTRRCSGCRGRTTTMTGSRASRCCRWCRWCRGRTSREWTRASRREGQDLRGVQLGCRLRPGRLMQGQEQHHPRHHSGHPA